MSKFKTIILSIFIVLVSLSSFAADREERRGKGLKGLRELNLTEQQMKSLKEFRKENKGKANAKDTLKTLKGLREEIKEAFISGASDDQIKSLNSRLQSEQASVKEGRLNKMLFMKNLLTSDQRKKFMEMRNKRKDSDHGDDE